MPNPENLRPPWQPGQSGNPAGYSRGRRVTDALTKLLDEMGGSDRDLAITWLAMATGRKSLLVDKRTGETREPNFAWFAALLERIEGKVVQPIAASDETIRPHAIPDVDPRESQSDEHPPMASDQGSSPTA